MQKFNISSAPPAIKQWVKNRQFEYPPKKLAPDHPPSTIHWYRTIQPPSRSGKWPPSYTANDTSDWGELRKTGSQGLFVVLMALSWFPLPECGTTSYTDFNIVLKDIKWIMNTLLTQAEQGDEAGMGGRKRKAASASQTLPKRKRTTK